jgi:hypothetical protein
MAFAGNHRVSWTSVQELFPGPKPKQWTLSTDDLAPWKSQAAAQVGTSVGVGDEKAWRLQGQSVKVVALRVPLAAGCEDGPFSFVVGVLDANGQLIARSSKLFSEGSDGNAIENPYRIDTAPYHISNSETAFGLRIVHYEVRSHSCYVDQVLHLFRVVSNDVVPILMTDAFYEQSYQVGPAKEDSPETVADSPNNPRCSFGSKQIVSSKGQGAVFRMLSSQTQGFYDIQRTQKGGATVTYRWNGQRYAMDSKDPVDHRAREEWDWCTGRRYLADHGFPPPAPPRTDTHDRTPSTAKAQAGPAVPRINGGAERTADAGVSTRMTCAREPFCCIGCDQSNPSPFKVGESFVDMKRAIAAANERLGAEDAFGKPRELRIGSVGVSVLEMSFQGMGGMVILRQDQGRVCVIGEWDWEWGGNGVDIDIAAVAQVPTRNASLVVFKVVGTSPHGTDDSSYYPDTRFLSAFLITAEQVDEVLSETVDENDSPSYGDWPEPVRIETSDSSLRVVYRRRAWVMGPDASQFVRVGRKRGKR